MFQLRRELRQEEDRKSTLFSALTAEWMASSCQRLQSSFANAIGQDAWILRLREIRAAIMWRLYVDCVANMW